MFNARGQNFSHENNKYFWVDSLETISSPYIFDEILFHPLQISTISSYSINTLPLCSNLLGLNNNHTKLPKLYKCTDYTTKFYPTSFYKVKYTPTSTPKQVIARTKLSHLPFPYVICGLPWAATPIENKKIHWLDKCFEKEVTLIDKKLLKKRIACTNHLLHILTAFEKRNYAIEYLTLNNPNSIFGERVSVFPTNLQAPLSVHRNINTIAICTVASVELAYGKIFLIQPYPENNPDLIVLCQKQDLSVPNDSEWNNIFNTIIPIHNSTDFYEFFKSIKKLNLKNVSTNSALLAIALPSKIVTEEFCLSFSNHIFSRFIKRLQFYVASVLKYPAGMTYEQRKKIIYLSRSICKAPNDMWVTKMFSYWLR